MPRPEVLCEVHCDGVAEGAGGDGGGGGDVGGG